MSDDGHPAKIDADTEDLNSRLAGRLLRLDNADAELSARDVQALSLRTAGVLVPIVNRPGSPTVLLTLRSQTLTHHAGQIAFPGGRAEPADVDIVATALRETCEETGIDATFITPVGRLEPVESITRFLMIPVVAVVEPGFVPRPNPGEVAAIFEVPLSFVIDPVNHARKSGIFAGVQREFYSLTYGDYDIWGATARILVNLAQRINGVPDLM